MVIVAVLLAAMAEPRLESWKSRIRHWLYVDDWIIQAPLEAVSFVLDCVLGAAAAKSLELQLSKCCFHVPRFAQADRSLWPDQMVAFDERVPHRIEGITMLDTDACGDLGVPLYKNEPRQLPRQTLKRKLKAMALAEATLEMIALAPPASAKQAGYTIARCVVAHALDYDAGVVTCSSLLPHASDLDNAVLRIAAATLDLQFAEISDDLRLQIQLPTRCAGIQLDMPSLLVPLARAARLVETGPAVRAAISSWELPLGWESVDPCCYDGVTKALEDGLCDMVGLHGLISLGGGGGPSSGGRKLDEASLRPPAPEKHLLSKYLRHVADQGYARLIQESSSSVRTRLLSASGPTSGTSFTAPLSALH